MIFPHLFEWCLFAWLLPLCKRLYSLITGYEKIRSLSCCSKMLDDNFIWCNLFLALWKKKKKNKSFSFILSMLLIIQFTVMFLWNWFSRLKSPLTFSSLFLCKLFQTVSHLYQPSFFLLNSTIFKMGCQNCTQYLRCQDTLDLHSDIVIISFLFLPILHLIIPLCSVSIFGCF